MYSVQCAASGDVDSVVQSIMLRAALRLQAILQCHGSLERCCPATASLATLVCHAGMQISAVSAAVKGQAVCCRAGGREGERGGERGSKREAYVVTSCSLHGGLV